MAFGCFLLLIACAWSQPLDVIIVPHSHCDAGYRETFWGYFRDKVNLTLTSVVSLLAKDPSKKFVWEEVSYMKLWWDEQNEETRNTVLRLEKSGQLEFIGGGWVMHDEADGTIAQQINQMAHGLEWLDNNLGVRPRHLWQIDPFGHSATNALITSLLYYESMILNRMDANLKQVWKQNKSLEFIWLPNSLLSSSSSSSLSSNFNDDDQNNINIAKRQKQKQQKQQNNHHDSPMTFVHFLDSHYGTPPIPAGDVKSRATWLAQAARARAQWYQAPLLMIPFGGDFDFTDAPVEFSQIDPLIEYINAQREGVFANMTLRYGTLNDYYQTLASFEKLVFPVLSDIDFYPYVACDCDDQTCTDPAWGHVPCGSKDAYWSGYFTSKPAQKLLNTKQAASLRTAETLYSLRRLANTQPDPPISVSWWDTLVNARSQSALYQHHDAITGTCFEHCTISTTECDCYGDYTKRLTSAINDTDVLVSQLLETILNQSDAPPPSPLPALGTNFQADFTLLFTQGKPVTIVVVNDMAWERTNELIAVGPLSNVTSLLMNAKDIKITRASDLSREVVFQFVHDPVRDVTTLYFDPITIAPLSITTFFVELVSAGKKEEEQDEEENSYMQRREGKFPMYEDYSLSNGVIGLEFSNGRVSSLLDGATNKIPLTQDYLRYSERLPTTTNIFTGSNVYDFTPLGPPSSLFPPTPSSVVAVASGPLVWEAAVVVNAYVSHTYRIFKNSSQIVNQVRIGEMPRDVSSSVSLRFTPSSMQTHGIFYTDTNSYSRMTRRQNASRPIQGNLYPTSSKLSVVDEKSGLSFHLLTSRSVGATSVNGSLEMLLHRRILDIRDTRGNDSATIDEPLILHFEKTADFHSAATVAALKLASPFAVRSASISSIAAWRAEFTDELSTLAQPLPADVHMMDLKALSNATQCPNGMRLWRVNGEKGDPATNVSLQSLFTSRLQLLKEFTIDYLVPGPAIDTAELSARGAIGAFVFNFFI